MVKPYDLAKIAKLHNKKYGVKDGFYDPITWIDTGNKALNKMISGDFNNGVPLGGVAVFAGQSGCLPATAIVRIRIREKLYIFNKEEKIEKNITVGELRDLYQSGKYQIEIDTPDGYQSILEWFDKGVLPLVKITTENGSTICARNHPIQRSDKTWALAAELVNDEIITKNGIERIISIINYGEDLCYDFEIDHPNHRYWGDGICSHNSAKSYLVSGNIVRNALAQNINVVVIDSEDALKTKWVTRLGVDPDHPRLVKYVKNTINELVATINDFTTGYRKDYVDVPREEQPKILFVIDSLGFIDTDSSIEQFENNELKGDKGLKAKALKSFIGNCIRLFAGFEIGLVATNHVYKSQDMYAPDDVISGGSGQLFASSIIVSMNKKKLKVKITSKGGKTGSDIVGIISTIKCVKTRFSKPFEEVEIEIPWSTGMDPYSGLFEMFKNRGLFTQEGSYYSYINKAQEKITLYRKDMDNKFFDMVMNEFPSDDDMSRGFDLTSTIDDEDEASE